MKNGYEVRWTAHAVLELKELFNYLEENWTEKEIRKFVHLLDETIGLISKFPLLFPSSIEKEYIRKAVIGKHNSLYYLVRDDTIEILSLHSNRKNPEDKKFN